MATSMSDRAKGKQPDRVEPLSMEFEQVSLSVAAPRSADHGITPAVGPGSSSSHPNLPIDPLRSPSFSNDIDGQFEARGTSFSHEGGPSGKNYRNLQLPQRISTSPRFPTLTPSSPASNSILSAQSTPTGTGERAYSSHGSQGSLSPVPTSQFENNMLLPAVPRGTYKGSHSVTETGGQGEGGASGRSSRRSSGATVMTGRYDGSSAQIMGYGQDHGDRYNAQEYAGGDTRSRYAQDRPSVAPTPQYLPKPGCVACSIVSQTTEQLSQRSFSRPGSSSHDMFPPISSDFLGGNSSPVQEGSHVDPFSSSTAMDRYPRSEGPGGDVSDAKLQEFASEPMSRPGSTKPLIQDETAPHPTKSSPLSSSKSRMLSHAPPPDRSNPVWIQRKKIILQTPEITVWESPHPKSSPQGPSLPGPSSPRIASQTGFLGFRGKKAIKVDDGDLRGGKGSVEAVTSGGRHLVIVLNRHLQSIYELGPSDVPILHSTLEIAHSLLDRIQETLEVEKGPGAMTKSMVRQIGFVSGNLRDSAHPYSHIHIHAILGPFDLASWYRKNAVFGWANWYELEDLIAEIRETTSNNRIKSGYGPVRRDAPINRVLDAGSVSGLSNALEGITGPAHRENANPGTSDRASRSDQTGMDFEDGRKEKLEEIDRLIQHMGMDKAETENFLHIDRSSASGMV